MRALVLGATGFIGGAIARSALSAGWEVRGMRRSDSRLDAVRDLSLDWRDGDLLDRASLRAAMDGCEVVFHAAGYYPTVALNRDAALRRGVEGMRNVLAAAKEAGVRRVVYTSSLSTIGSPDERLADERDHYLPGAVPDPYWEVKWLMEQECYRACVEGLEVVITNPTICFGPGDVKPTSGIAVLLVVRGRLPMYIDGAWNVVDVRDVAEAHLAAAERGRPGQRYILGGHNVSVSILLNAVARAAGVSPPRLLVPTALVRGAAWASELLAVATRRPPLLPIEGVDMVRFGQHFDCTLAREELGLGSRPLEATVRDAIEWFRAHGYLPGA